MSGSEFEATSVLVLPLTLSSLSWMSFDLHAGMKLLIFLREVDEVGREHLQPELGQDRQLVPLYSTLALGSATTAEALQPAPAESAKRILRPAMTRRDCAETVSCAVPSCPCWLGLVLDALVVAARRQRMVAQHLEMGAEAFEQGREEDRRDQAADLGRDARKLDAGGVEYAHAIRCSAWRSSRPGRTAVG